MLRELSDKSNSRLSICIIGNQAFSLLNFRGPLIAEMVKRGLNVFALVPDYDEHSRAEVRALGAEPIDFSLSRTGMNPIKDATDMLLLTRLLRELKPEIILCYAIKPVVYGTLAAWFAQVPKKLAMIEGLGYVFTPSVGREPFKRQTLRCVVNMLYIIAFNFADLVFFLNKDDINYFIKRGLIPPSKTFLLGGIGVDLDDWAPAPPVTDPVTFLLVARLLKEKGIEEYAKAAKLIKQKYKDTRFILIGSLDSNPGALSLAEIEAWIDEGVLEWPGKVPYVRPWIAESSVFVLPSYYREGVPRSTQEAMAMARPIITTDAPGCNETVIDGENGYLVPIRDSEALAKAMERFIELPDLIEKMGLASRKIAEERFNVHEVNLKILKEIERLIGPSNLG